MRRPRLVVLDGYTLNPGDLSWDDLRELAVCDIFDRTVPAELIGRTGEAELVLTNKVVLDRSVLTALEAVRYVGVLATGFNIVDVETARERGIVVTNVPAYSSDSVAQLAFALLLELTFQTGHHCHRVRNGAWAQCPDFSFREAPLIELAGRTMGVVGFGRIGRRVAEIAAAFGMTVLAATRSYPKTTSVPVDWVSLDELFRRSDVVSLHCPLTPQTEHLVDRAALARMKPEAYLINTSRGPLVDEAALAEALRDGRIAGAGLDVLSQEPPPADHPLVSAPRCLITPHVGWGTTAARRRLMHEAVENVRAFLNDEPRNVVS